MGRYLKIADELMQDRWARKAAALLSTIDDPDTRAAMREQFEERAGIAEYDGGLPRDEAERIAFEEIQTAMRERVR